MKREFSEEHRKNLSKACMGRVPWNKGLTKKDPRVRKYLKGSKNTQFKPGPKPETKGSGNPNWKGGKTINIGKYILVRCPEHPAAVSAGKGGGYVFEHRLIMEATIGRYLRKDEVVHHINGNTTDNRIENLQIMTTGEHTRLHHHGTKRRKRKKNLGVKNETNTVGRIGYHNDKPDKIERTRDGDRRSTG